MLNEIGSAKLQYDLLLRSQNSTLKGVVDDQESSGHHLTPKLANDNKQLEFSANGFDFLERKSKSKAVEDNYLKMYNKFDMDLLNQL